MRTKISEQFLTLRSQYHFLAGIFVLFYLPGITEEREEERPPASEEGGGEENITTCLISGNSHVLSLLVFNFLNWKMGIDGSVTPVGGGWMRRALSVEGRLSASQQREGVSRASIPRQQSAVMGKGISFSRCTIVKDRKAYNASALRETSGKFEEDRLCVRVSENAQ
ncbi:uncharacterized protein BO95DRAFT_202516 [Aspergillus brunneoviolaceus CBS 621.78]|uniref:Uncharacterized protein n=1 Tax=Aspergillus brunneoviolaceus CBS 621.78 TaxID=1450534 RepID=A0ACD1G3C0_9EURO|nr:hypothetical protein BO95DRAFT_202516 [Aspergillus brunneoviolaceus CBS 621.78]RAH43715.1 hypothetical protein BO95DRAFT_202516 [Aspergillus brunneoviolaceus CBS 621.78]